MRDYLTNLAARSLDSTPAIQPRLASLFEPLRDVGLMFPRPTGHRLESTTQSEQAVHDPTHAQPRAANDPENPPRVSSSPITAVKAFAHAEEIEGAQPRVPKHEHRPVATTVKPAAEQPPKLEKLMDGISTGFQSVSTELSAPEADTQPVVAAGRPLSANENTTRNRSNRGKTASPAARDEGAPTSPVDIREPNQPASSVRLQNKSGERSTSDQFSAQPVANESTPVTRADHADQPGQSKALVVPRIVIERIRADRAEQPPVSVPVSVGPKMGMPPRPSTTDLGGGFRVRPAADLHQEPSQTEAVEPVINVTIGRVEVRALAAPNAPPKDRNSASSSKLMSLDDYLRQRAQGDRR